VTLFRIANRRFFRRHPRHLLLTVLGIALGVSVMTGIDLSIESTRKAFALSMDAIVGGTTHHILASVGGLDERLYPQLRMQQGLRDIAPVVEGYVKSGNETLRVLGIDPFAEAGVRGRFQQSAQSVLARLLGEADTVLLAGTTAERLGLRVGDRLSMDSPGGSHAVTVLGTIEGDGPADAALEGLALADIATAQEILDRPGLIDRIDVVLPQEPAAEMRLRADLPAGVVLQSAEGRNTAAARMTDAFSTNLKALSSLALLVGMFIIYNTMTFNLLQRRPLLATLRVLGVTRGQILGEILLEAGALGSIGALFGVILALLAAQGLLHLVTRTINDVYFVLTVTRLFIAPAVLAKGVLIGVSAALLASLPPALEAAWSQPVAAQRRSLLELRTRRLLPWVALTGTGMLALSYGLLSRPESSLQLAIVGVFFLLLGYGFLTPAVVAALTKGAALLCGVWGMILPRLALRGIAGTLSRTGVAVAALTLSIAASVGTGVMVHSFRVAVTEWLEQILQADIYLSLPSVPGRASETLPPQLLEQVRTLTGLERISTGRRVFVETSQGTSELLALDPAYADRPPFRFKYGDGSKLWKDFQSRDALLISEPYASRHGLKAEDHLTLHTVQGTESLPVLGIFFDYRSDQGVVVMHRRLYDRLWRDPGISSLGLYLAPGVDVKAVKDEIRRKLSGERRLVVRSNREIRTASMELFDRTFTVTQVLRLQALGVAFIGILSALLAVQAERTRELAILRAIGLTPGQLKALVLLQTGFLGLCAGLLALPLGFLTGLALVRVINLRSFGWSMDLASPPDAFIEAVLLAVIAALLAGLYPAWRAARFPPAAALREE
jgi:putative ABC transport system permease protein